MLKTYMENGEELRTILSYLSPTSASAFDRLNMTGVIEGEMQGL